ncbi:hypothetical protein DPMN_098384 [Dreissena polymorpha]|uniref:Brinker DNA-binding domain-containing protein n=1 Tax=Dreissena polymorpha TaxID=45954 RepID=A0A9D4LDI1_DREPO|nr:hypothetical protein DPMN_098384 [Dreissena polymorpha]
MGKVRTSYTAKEKLAAISYAEAHGNRAAGRKFGCNEACVRLWRKLKPSLLRQKKKPTG